MADLEASASPETGVMDSEVILPLFTKGQSSFFAHFRAIALSNDVPEAEEVANLLLRGGGGDARNVDGGLVRHGDRSDEKL